MNRALTAFAVAVGIVKLAAPLPVAVVVANAKGLQTPHVLFAPPKHERGVAAVEVAEVLVVRPVPEATAATETPVPVMRAPAVAPQPFDVAAAKIALVRSMESLPICRRGDASGPGTAEITWSPDGTVARVALSSPYAASASRGCVARRFQQAAVTPYDAPPQTMRVRFSL